MDSNWAVTYRSGESWPGPGPLEEYIGLRLWAVEQDRAAGIVCPVKKDFFEQVAALTTFRRDPPGQGVNVSAPPLVSRYFWATAHWGSHDLALVALVGRALRSGPKLFRPTPAECEPLEQAELTLPVESIRLPFPVCVVEFPPDYAADRLVDSFHEGDEVRPWFCVVAQEDGAVVTGTVCSLVGAPGCDSMTVCLGTGRFEDILAEEREAAERYAPFLRAAVNYLLLAAGNHRLARQPDAAQSRSLRERIRRAKRGGRAELVRELRTRLRRLPSVFALNQEVRLFEREPPGGAGGPGGDGPPKRPHWRRGHWRRVAVGVRRVGREWRFIPPVLVNAPLLSG